MAEENITGEKEKEESGSDNDPSLINFFSEVQNPDNGKLPEMMDNVLAEVDTMKDYDDREAYYELTGDGNRLKDYEPTFSKIARSVASEKDEEEGIVTKSWNTLGDRLRDSWSALTGDEKRDIASYENDEDTWAAIMVDAGVPLAAMGVASLIGFGAIPVIAVGGSASFFLNVGKEGEELEDAESFLISLSNMFGSDFKGFFDPKEKYSPAEKALRMAGAAALDFGAGSAVLKGGKKAYQKVFKDWLADNKKPFMKQVENGLSLSKKKMTGRERKGIKKLVRSNKLMKVLRDTQDVVINGRVVDEELASKKVLQEMFDKRGIAEKAVEKGVKRDAKTIAATAGGKNFLNRKRKNIDLLLSDAKEHRLDAEGAVKLAESITDDSLAFELRSSQGLRKMKEKGKETLDRTTEEGLGIREITAEDVIKTNIDADKLFETRMHLMISGKSTPEALKALRVAETVQSKGQKLVRGVTDLDLASTRNLMGVEDKIKGLRAQMYSQSKAALRNEGMDQQRNLSEVRTLLQLVGSIREKQLKALTKGQFPYLAQMALRANVDYFLANGAFTAAALGNVVNYGVKTAAHFAKRQGIARALYDVSNIIPSMGGYLLKRTFTINAWRTMYKEMSLGKDIYRHATTASAGGVIKRITNAATAVNQQMLHEVDKFFTTSFKQVADRQALGKVIRERLDSGYAPQVVIDDLTQVAKKNKLSPVDFTTKWKEANEGWHRKVQLRGELKQDYGGESSMLAKPFWLMHQGADTLRESDVTTLRFFGQAAGLFSRTAANLVEQAARFSPLGALDKHNWAKNKAEMLVGTAISLSMYLKSNIGNTLIGHHSLAGDSMEGARRMGNIPGIVLRGEDGPFFMPLKNMGSVGESLRVYSLLENIMRGSLAEGDDSMSRKAADALGRIVQYMTADSWLMATLFPVLQDVDRGGAYEVQELFLPLVLRGLPGSSIEARLRSALAGYRPDASFLEALAENSEQLPQGPSRDAFGNIYSSNIEEAENADGTGFTVSLGRIQLGLNPLHKNPSQHNVELNDFLLGLGAYSKSETISFTAKSGKQFYFNKSTFRAMFSQTIRPLNRKVNYAGDTAYKMTARDYHASKAILSLRPDAVKETAEQWLNAYEILKVEYPGEVWESDFLEKVVETQRDFKNMSTLYDIRSEFSGYVPSKMIDDKEKGLSHFLHYMAVTPLDKMSPESASQIKNYSDSFKDAAAEWFKRYDIEHEDSDLDEFSLLLGRRALIIEMYNMVKKQVSAVSVLAPSVVEEAINRRQEGAAAERKGPL